MAVGDTILIKDISINGNKKLTTDPEAASKLSETLKDNTINAFGIDASSRTIWVNGQPYGNAYVNIKEDNTIEAPIGAEIFNDFENNIASGEYSHAEGKETKALGDGSHAEGQGIVSGNYIFSGPIDNEKIVYKAQYTNGLEIGDILIRERDNYTVYITAIDVDNKNVTFNNTFGPINNQQLKKITGSFGQFSHSEGNETIANKHAAHAEGFGTKAFGQNSHAEGEKSKSIGKDSHSEGSNTVAAGDNSHAEGAQSTAGGPSSHAEGYMTEAKSSQSHAEGYGTIIDGDIEVGGMWLGPTASHAEGYLTKVIAQGQEGGLIANGQAAHVEGYMTEAHNLGEHAEGRLNLSHTVTPKDASKPTEEELSKSTLHSVGMGFPDPTDPDNREKDNRMNAHEIMQDGKHYIYGIGGYDGTNPGDSKDIATYLPNMVNITYKELVDLRKESNLVPGQQYRITDYICTTTQTGTKSAENLFDIIVTADSENKLNEEARAIQHTNNENDYFAKCNLNAWKLWYSLDNDKNRFAWADNRLNDDGTERGKGVIYRMIDEFSNDCPYDFKNIQFYRQWDEYYQLWSFISSDDTSSVPCYTFSSGGDENTAEFTDMSLNASNNIYSNVIKEYIITEYINSDYRSLNNICFFGSSCYNNTFRNDCYNNTFGDSCNNNIFGDECTTNVFREGCYGNTFGTHCFGNNFQTNCGENTFGNYCLNNSFGNYCIGNIFGNSCDGNIFGDYCGSNSIGENCTSIKFASDKGVSIKYKYYQNNHFGDGCKYIIFQQDNYTEDNNPQYIQNYKFAQGLQGTSRNYLHIEGQRNRAHETYISKDTDGIVKESVIAELVNMIEISYNDLKNLKSKSKLIPGCQYRITDYNCTTSQKNTQSANHQFDIIVTADSTNKLNEEARAINHDFANPESKDHFKDCNLAAWKLWYSLDNDINRFAWADNTNGKGVIYRMIDEWNNDCPYDFKNIQFIRYAVTSKIIIENNGSNAGDALKQIQSNIESMHPSNTTISSYFWSGIKDDNIKYWDSSNFLKSEVASYNKRAFFTFSSIKDTFIQVKDTSLTGKCHSNTIKEFFFGKKLELNNIVFFNDIDNNNESSECYNNSFNYHCYNNSFGNNCHDNTFWNNCHDNTFGNDCYYNTFGNECYYITFGNKCQDNTLGNFNTDNNLGSNCLYNTIGNGCSYNTIVKGANSIGNNCVGNCIKQANQTINNGVNKPLFT